MAGKDGSPDNDGPYNLAYRCYPFGSSARLRHCLARKVNLTRRPWPTLIEPHVKFAAQAVDFPREQLMIKCRLRKLAAQSLEMVCSKTSARVGLAVRAPRIMMFLFVPAQEDWASFQAPVGLLVVRQGVPWSPHPPTLSQWPGARVRVSSSREG